MTKKDTVYQIVLERILYLEYQPGQILNEKSLSDEFKISRSPVKEILNRLNLEEFIRIIPRTGSMVTEIEFSRIMNIYQVRFEMEAFEAKLAVGNFQEQHCDKLEEMIQKCRTLSKDKDTKALTRIDIALRDIIHEAAGNPVLAKLSDQLYFQTFRLWYSVLSQSGWLEEVDSVKTEINQVLNSISSNTPDSLIEIRQSQLMAHFDRLRKKFLGN